ncbi:MAG: exodeoxyribonuclease V subunit gamma [Pseudomonadota bacterium]
MEGEGSGPAGARTLELARQLADVFDRLVVFRPELAVAWSQGGAHLPSGAADLAWQPRLWAAVRRHLAARGLPVAHSAERWLEVTRQGAPDPACFHQPLRVFGVSFLPPASLRQLAWLSRAVDVELYLTCPSDLWWAGLHGLGPAAVRDLFGLDRDQVAEQLVGIEAVRPHPLLQSLGRVGRDQQLVLEELGDAEVQRRDSGAFVDPAGEPAPGEPVSALHALQSDLLHLRDPAAFSAAALAARALSPVDDSIQFHACYGLTRQVEVLREALLHLFEAHPDLEPRDVLVMAPDIEACVPLVGAVFDQGRDAPLEREGRPLQEPAAWGRAGAPRVPCVITERSVRRTNPVAEVLLRVLALAGGQQRVSSAAVLDLLAVEPFRERFGIAQGDVEVIAAWVEESGVRWGIDPADRARSQQPPEVQNTWHFGLERLALGVTMADSPGRLWDAPAPGQARPAERALGVAPADPVEGGIVHLLGRFFEACTALFDVLRRLGDAADGRPLEAWIDAAIEAQERLTATPPSAAWLAARVRSELEELRAVAQAAGAARPLRLEAFQALVERRFEVASGATRAHAGAVTFASMLPFRSVPYRVVCLLGMDEGAFPRNPARARFDLTQRLPRAGDHDPRDEDRHLLLEALLAARDHLLVLYTGRDPRSNEPRAPAVPIAELRAVIDASFPAVAGQRASAWLTTEHPLQPFSPRCFAAGAGRPWSYDRDLLDGCRASLLRARAVRPFFDPGLQVTAPQTPTLGENPVLELPIVELARFLRSPTRALLARGLNLYLPPDEEPPPEREPIEPNGLDRWSWSQRLLAERWARMAARWGQAAVDEPTASSQARLRAEGLLPLGAGGQRWAEAPAALVDALLAAAAAWFGDEQAPTRPGGQPLELSLELPTHHVRLLGASGPLWGGDQLVLGVGDIEGQGKYRLEPWLRHLAWVAAEGPPAARTVLLFGRLDGHGEPALQRASLALPLPQGAAPRAWAHSLLEALAGLYLTGLTVPLPLFEQASWAFAKRCFYYGRQRFGPEEIEAPWGSLPPAVHEHLEGAWLAARRAFGADGPSEYSATDLEDPHIALAWGGADPTTEEREGAPALSRRFARLALQLWAPVFDGWVRHGKKTPVEPRDGCAGGEP